MCIATVQKGSACGHWYMKVGTGDAILIPIDWWLFLGRLPFG